MSEVTGIQQEKEGTESQLARHLEQQPASIQSVHKVMLALEAVVAILYIGLLILAVYVSVTWKTYGELAVPRWWMSSMVTVALLLVILGLHTLIVKAFLPIPYPSGKESIVMGRQAERQGWMFIGLGLLWAALWGGMYLGIVLSGAKPLETFIPFVVILSIGVGVIGALVSAIEKWVKSR